MRVRRDNTSCDTSLMILAFSLGERVVNHFARRCLGGQSGARRAQHGGPRDAYNFALPREQNEIATGVLVGAFQS